ncbi:MAG TPA: hypothetical protein VMM58_01090 [Bacteroidota bacterium]|nr:hypothetical protein [Bacteroidota bacterium]
MPLTKVLIAVKTYPTPSTKYDETVCTAGFKEDGSWVRIYPVQYRKKEYSQQYKKYDWVEVDLVRNFKDFRPETYRPYSAHSKFNIVGHIATENEWEGRKKIILGKVYKNLSVLIDEAKNKLICTSLAVFKPTTIKDFVWEKTEREWSKERFASMNQFNLFEKRKGKFEVVRKLPYKFFFIFEDDEKRESRLMIEDWETGQLFWKCLSRHEGNEREACEDVKGKYFDDFAKTKDLYFFLGTTKEHHYVSNNPFIIIGTFHPKHQQQLNLF